jgi:hypothetical protein
VKKEEFAPKRREKFSINNDPLFGWIPMKYPCSLVFEVVLLGTLIISGFLDETGGGYPLSSK